MIPAPEVAGSIDLQGGQKYDLRVEYYEAYIAAAVKLEWHSASQAREIVPDGVLFTSTNAPAVVPVGHQPSAHGGGAQPFAVAGRRCAPAAGQRPAAGLAADAMPVAAGRADRQCRDFYAADLGTNSAWLGGTRRKLGKSPYYFKGLVALAYTLNDAGLKLKAQKWMDWLLTHQGADGYLGPVANNDWWPRMIATYALKDYYEATADAARAGGAWAITFITCS